MQLRPTSEVTAEAIEYVRRFMPDTPEQECTEIYAVFLDYKRDGYTNFEARKMAGLLTPKEIGEY